MTNSKSCVILEIVKKRDPGGRMANKNLTRIRNRASFSGIASFVKSKVVDIDADWISDFTILGVPFDLGVEYCSGTRFALREIRDLSTRCSFLGNGGSNGYWSIETKENLLKDAVAVDAGDVDISLSADYCYCLKNITDAIRKILEHYSMPIVIGDDHSISFTIVQKFAEKFNKLSIIHIDAQLDFKDELCGIQYAQRIH